MALDQSGVAYLYANVGVTLVPTQDQPGVAYLYDNAGVGGVGWRVGRISAMQGDFYGVSYLYVDVT